VKSRPPVKLEDRLIYSEVIEGLIQHGLGGHVPSRLRERLGDLGLDVDHPPSTFPVVTWLKCLRVIIEELFPGVPMDEAFRRLARQHVEGYGRTLMGRATVRVMRLLGPRRMVQRLPSMLSATDNYTAGTVEERGPTEFVLTLNSSQQPSVYVESLFEAMLSACGAVEPRVKQQESHEDRATYLLTWSEKPGGASSGEPE
jgi:uncharacterized protein (TIGR02265 family)